MNINLRLKLQHPSTQVSVNGPKLKWISLLRWKMLPTGNRLWIFWVQRARRMNNCGMNSDGRGDQYGAVCKVRRSLCTWQKFHSGTISPQPSQPKVIQIKFTRSSSTSRHLAPSMSRLQYEFLLHFVMQITRAAVA